MNSCVVGLLIALDVTLFKSQVVQLCVFVKMYRCIGSKIISKSNHLAFTVYDQDVIG